MIQILITGGTGVLGRELVAKLKRSGYTVRVMSRRSRPLDAPPDIEWVQADLETGAGLEEAVNGVQTIVHAATYSSSTPIRMLRIPYHSWQVDVAGTRRLLDRARTADIAHVVYISIVGIDRIPFFYYRHKLEAEKLVAASGVPWSVLRATQFHTLMDIALRFAARWPFLLLPTDFQFQPIDPGEVADRLCDAVAAEPAGRLPDVGGPEVWTLGDLARIWLDIRGLRRSLLHLALPGQIAEGFRRGYNTSPQNRYGQNTWSDWVKLRYSH